MGSDPTWKQSWAGKVYTAIGKLNTQPESFIKYIDRVEEDLVNQVLTPSASKKNKI